MRARVQSLVLRPITPPLALGLAVAAVLLAAESLVVYLLKQVVPGNLFGVVFVLGVLVVSLGWGFRLGTITALASALVYAYFHYLQTGGSFVPTDPRHWVAVAVFLVIALSATALAGVARLRAVAADERRREVEASHDELSVLAGHQAALRRVATLVARGVTPSELFSAVAEELARCLGLYHHAVLFRYEPDNTGVLLAAGHGDRGLKVIPVGERFSLEGESVAAEVFRTRRAARMVSYENASGSVAARFRDLGLRTAVGAPIVVDGRLWGAAIIGSTEPAPLPAETEARVGDFTDLVATAIANAQTHAELTASRVRIVAAADDARRRIERDLHDGAQQRLVSLGLELRAAEARVPTQLNPLKEQISHLVTTVAEISTELQELSRGIHPAILSKGGLSPALKTLARRSAIPVELVLTLDRRLPDSVRGGSVLRCRRSPYERGQTRASDCGQGVRRHRGSQSAPLGSRRRNRRCRRRQGIWTRGSHRPRPGARRHLVISSHPGNGTSLDVNIPFESE